jgi:PAS domain S-box-containing protein
MDERQRHREVLAINRALAGAENYGEVLRLVVERTAAIAGATSCLLLLSQADGLARVVQSVGIDPAKAAKLAVSLTERVGATLCDLLGFQSTDGFVGVPVIGKDGLMGILAVYREEPSGVDGAQDDELISAFADQAAIALDNAERVRRLGNEEAVLQSEQRLRALADAMPQLAWTARPDGHTTWYNRRWYEYTGTTPAQMEGWGWQSVHDPATLPAVLRSWKESIATGNVFDMEFPLRRADGRFRHFLTRASPVKDSGGNVTQWFGTNTDVTDLVEAEAALREADPAQDRVPRDAVARAPQPPRAHPPRPVSPRPGAGRQQAGSASEGRHPSPDRAPRPPRRRSPRRDPHRAREDRARAQTI